MTTPAPPAGLSRRAFGQLVGVSRTIIQRLVDRGDLPVDADGKLPMPAALHAYARVRTVGPKAASEAPAGPEAPAPTENATTGQPARPPLTPALGGRAEAELERIRWQARLAELKARQVAGELVTRSAVEEDARATCTAIRAGLLALPPRLALLLEALCANGAPGAGEIQQVLEDEVNSVLEHLHTSRFAGGSDAVA